MLLDAEKKAKIDRAAEAVVKKFMYCEDLIAQMEELRQEVQDNLVPRVTEYRKVITTEYPTVNDEVIKYLNGWIEEQAQMYPRCMDMFNQIVHALTAREMQEEEEKRIKIVVPERGQVIEFPGGKKLAIDMSGKLL